MREHAQGYKTAFSVPSARAQNFSYLGLSSDEGMAIPMLKPMAQHQKLALIFSARKMPVFRRSTSLGYMVDVSADVNHVLFVLAT